MSVEVKCICSEKHLKNSKITEVGDDYAFSNITIQSNHRQTSSIFVCNFVMPIVKSKLDLTLMIYENGFRISCPYYSI